MIRTTLAVIILGILAACSGVVQTDLEPGETPAATAAHTPTDLPSTLPAATIENVPAAEPTLEPATIQAPSIEPKPTLQEYKVPAGSHPHDVAPAADGTVWYTAQAMGALGNLNPETGEIRQIPLGQGSAPHGVIVGPDGAPWITDSGLNAILRVDPQTEEVQVFALPPDRSNANLNTAVFDSSGILWFTGQSGIYGRLDPASKEITVFSAPRGPGPYGITSFADGSIYYASLANNHIARINPLDGSAAVLEPPTARQGARRVWGDSRGNVWVSEWNVGQIAVYRPAENSWQEWKLPGNRPQAYAIYVDDRDFVWLSDFRGNSMMSFDPVSQAFTVYPLPSANASVRQILGRPGEVWGAESGADRLVVIRTGGQ